ncbi:unnamed protein product [Effrenium voratum]|uniref:Uncharacterized protein n=1 Tax=Effrenium voratum TaxID=2562239 RepID=A0AA36I3H6_9DINO|nr:unnamed protein product [Effrenium voratum]
MCARIACARDRANNADNMRKEREVELERKKREDEQEMERKRDLIREIRALEKVPVERAKLFDPAEPPCQGLLEEMSLAELKERLRIVTAQKEKELDMKRERPAAWMFSILSVLVCWAAAEQACCGMGVAGECVATMDWRHMLASLAPGSSANFFNTFLKVWEDASPLTGTIFCLGDRPGSWIVSNTYGQNGGLYDSFQGLTYLRNLFMDPGDSETWGTVGLYMGLFCPSGTSVDQYTELKVGFAFNKCNSGVNFMLSISADTIECFADKFAPVISRLAGLIPELSFGISIDRKLFKTVTVAHGDGDSIRVGSITLHSHLAMSTTIRLSIGQLLGMDDTIGDVLAGDLQAQFAVAYDSTDSLVSALTWMASSDPSDSLPDLVGGFASAYKVGPTAAAALLRQSGAANQVVSLVEGIQHCTSMLQVNGYVTLALSEPSRGILPDMSFHIFQVNMMLRTGPAESSQDADYAQSHLPGLYFYLSADLGAFVQSIVSTVLGQIGGLLDVVGADISGGISLSASQGIGFFVNTAGLGFYTEAKLGGSTTEIKCVFKYGNGKLKCKARLGWAELFLSGGKFVLRKINNFAGSGAQEVAEFFKEDVGGTGAKFAKSVVNKGKKIAQRAKCKLSNLLGGSCGKSGGTPSSCGDGTEYVIKNEEDKCLSISPDCYSPQSDGKVYFYDSAKYCMPLFDECTHFSSSYSTQMRNFWWFTKDRYLCNEYMHNMYFGDIPDPDDNPKCLRLENQKVWFSRSPSQFHIAKKSTERFRVSFHGITGPYGQVCLQSSSGGATVNQGRRRRRFGQEVIVRGYDGGRRRRRCDKGGASNMRIYQKLEPGNGMNYEKENGDAQFLKNCR